VSLSLMTCHVSGTSLSYAAEKLALPTLGHPYVYTSTWGIDEGSMRGKLVLLALQHI
jgi:hypothetical protein